MTSRLNGLLICCLLMGCGNLFAETKTESSWFQFRGPLRNGVSNSTQLLSEWPVDGPKLVWQADGAGRGYASVAIYGDRIITMGDGPSTADDENEYLSCFDLNNGQQIWQTKLGKPWTGGPDSWQSSRSTPTIDGEMVYTLTAHGDLICAKTNDGSEIWRKSLKDDFAGKKGDGWGYSESVLIDGGLLVCTPGGTENTMVALNKSNGELVWSAARENDRGAGHASIVISEIDGIKVYVQTTASGVLGVRAKDGELMWSYEIERTTAVIPTPILRDNLVFFTAGYGRGGALLRQKAYDGQVEIEEVYPLNKKLQNKHGGVVLVGDFLYGDSGDSGTPFCADFMTGEVQWKKRGSGKGSAAITAADGHLYILFSNNVIALAKATSEGYKEISSMKIDSGVDRPTWAHPVVFDGRFYVRTDDKIFCYDVRSGS